MTKPTNLTLWAQEKLLLNTGSFYGDNFFIRCNMYTTNTFVDGFISSLLDWISFYFIGDASVFLVLILPVIFFFHSSGKQRKMQKLYSKSRCLIFKFVMLCTISISISPIIGWCIGRGSPCVEGVKSELLHFGYRYQNPSVNVVIAATICLFLFNTKGNKPKPEYKDLNWKEILFDIADRYSIKVVACIIAVFFFFVDLIYGKSSFIQAGFSICLGFLVYEFVDCSPIWAQLAMNAILFILGIIFMIFNPRPSEYPTAYDEVWRLLVTGFGFQVYISYLVFFFVRSRPEMSFKMTYSEFVEEEAGEISGGEAAFAELDTESEVEVDLKQILGVDLKHAAVATVIQITAGVVEEAVLALTKTH